jgi:GRAM domain
LIEDDLDQQIRNDALLRWRCRLRHALSPFDGYQSPRSASHPGLLVVDAEKPNLDLQPGEVLLAEERASLRSSILGFANGHLFLTNRRLLWKPKPLQKASEKALPLGDLRAVGVSGNPHFWAKPLLVESTSGSVEFIVGINPLNQDEKVSRWVSSIQAAAAAASPEASPIDMVPQPPPLRKRSDISAVVGMFGFAVGFMIFGAIFGPTEMIFVGAFSLVLALGYALTYIRFRSSA